MTAAVLREGTYKKWTNYALFRMKKRKLINAVKEAFCFTSLKGSTRKLRQARMKQALNQCDFITRQTSPKKVLIAENSSSSLAAGFRQKKIESEKTDTAGLRAGVFPKDNYDTVVLWNVLEALGKDGAEEAIRKIIGLNAEYIILLTETREYYDNAYDNPTRPRVWWAERFAPRYKEFEPRPARPLLDQDNWFYDYGLDRLMCFRRKD